jgi:3-oxoacyl-[acyl-carrier protein] reductase
MDLGIKDRVALVTAASRGIGLGIAKALAAEGAKVAIAARSADTISQAAMSFGGFGVAADLLKPEDCERAVTETRSALGPIDILVNNLGMRYGTSWADTGVPEFEAAFTGNVSVSVRMSQLVMPSMVERGWGRIVVISSIWGRESGGLPAYNAAKAAEISLVTSLGREVASKGITVNCVAPGSIVWEGGGWHRRVEQDPQGMADYVRKEMPLGRFGTVPEVASVVAFLCSQQASLVNASTVTVDGGQSRSNI